MAATGGTRRAAAWKWLAPGFVIFTLLRLPSFVEPHWYADEASYVALATSLLHGHVLYLQIWNNKPPLQSWTIAAVVAVFGPSELGLHLLTYASGAATMAALAFAGTRILSARRTGVALILAALFLGPPVVDAELALPESLLIAPIAWAGALLLVQLDPRRAAAPPQRVALWPFGVGLLVAAGIAYQQTAVAEATAFAIALGLSPAARWRDLAAYAGTVVAITGAWVVTAIVQAGAGRVGFALAGFYIPYTQSALPSAGSGVALHFGEVLGSAALVCGGAFLCRRSKSSLWVVGLWAGATLLVAGVARQPFAHYLTPSVAPVALLLAAVPPLRGVGAPARAGLLRAAPLALGVLGAGLLARVAGLDWIPQAAPSPNVNAYRNFAQYYGGAVAALLRIETKSAWDNSFDGRVAGDESVSAWLRCEGLSGVSAVDWSSDVWVYSLAGLPVLVPTPPIYNDEVLLGQHGPVAAYVANLRPELIIVAADAQHQFPEITPLLDGATYRVVFTAKPDTVWARAGTRAAQLTTNSCGSA